MSAFLNEYNVTPTISGQSIGSIEVVNVSGGTGPYTISWSGATPNGYVTYTQWDIDNLSEGVYKAKKTKQSEQSSVNKAQETKLSKQGSVNKAQ